MSALSTTGHNDGITLHCLQSIAQLIPLSSAVFYRVNAYLKPEAYVLHNISNSTHQQYLEHFQPLDPLSPSRFGQQVITVATMTPGICARHRHYYHEFMLPNHVCDMIEIFIRRGHRIIAGISLMRDIPFSSEERLRAQAVQPLLGLAIHDSLQEDNNLTSILTAKEREIVGMVCEGASNKLIARQLNISLSTVKTHLRNIFAKTEVINRTELVSRTRMPSVQHSLNM
ncbi:LuxR family transcriptional regulator [Salmonella enterica subsp. enterica]|uniref:Helix-turn-helix transcriptional regulator n=1 Tax=Salmonella enterica subsp. enterica serovar Macclesfield str. S-1643 TaxID=1242107 RepID=A0A2C9NVM1_SALET|nr:LuxR family transcriptional regulator [Salmonella enterica]EAA5484482.1 LuxR family transcriptional regulator [Salmonella enterica subsp. enterica serovar Kouka]EBG2393029.1 LuxR family transcriptional regulator [Salmonella enterica subsp. enterica serovar Everleigh]EBS1106778.1 LuxR family transcriptional regulator [Salmonella enterica subsp. enterica serovar Eingedi]ECH9261524.1 LuxR family transcriptional regulator [Salmonella enterica subsp. enterica]ASG15186.1 helix-turn-helix transcri